MDDRYSRANEIFFDVCDRPADEQKARLDAACGDDVALRELVEDLLRADRSSVSLESSLLDAIEVEIAGVLPGEVTQRPQRIGSYRVVAELGRGGMGVVYEAEQETPRRQVALKVIRSGFTPEELLRRFEHEARVLGWLNHPGIAQIYDAGVARTENGLQPFFAMELVRGVPITRYVAERKPGLRELLGLVEGVAHAVHHAHQKGVIHRDLKPGNILVDTEGNPKVLDFGVARAIESDFNQTTMVTRTGELVGTLSYMSPEQVQGDPSQLDTRADVYALGVLAYELIAGRLPLELESRLLPEAILAIVNEEPLPLARVARGTPTDVSTIVGKAMSKERHQRYASAEALAEDLARFRADQPILARPPSAIYQIGKFARRNRALVTGLCLLLLTLFAGVVVSTSQYLKAESARAETAETLVKVDAARAELATTLEIVQLERDTATETSDFLVGLFEHASPVTSLGVTLTAKELLDRGAERIRTRLVEHPRVQTRLMATMGRAYGQLNLIESSEPLLLEALERRRSEFGESSLEVADSLADLGSLRSRQTRYTEAVEFYERALAALEASGEPDPRRLGLLNARLVEPLVLTGQVELAEERGRAGLALLRDVHGGDDHDEVWAAKIDLSYVLTDRGRLDESEALLREVIASKSAKDGDAALSVAGTKASLGWSLLRGGRAAEALALFQEADAIIRRVFEPGHPSICNSIYNLASAEVDIGDVDRSIAHFREALACWRAAVGEDHYGLASVMVGLAAALELRDAIPESIELRERAIEIDLGVLRPDDAKILRERRNLSYLYANTGRFEEAVDQQLVIIEALEGADPPRWEDLGYAYRNAGQMEGARGRTDAAERLLQRSLEAFRENIPGGEEELCEVLGLHGALLIDLGRAQEAEPYLEEALALRRGQSNPSPAGFVQTLMGIGRLHSKLGRFEQAEKLLLDAVERAEALEDDTPDLAWLRSTSKIVLAELYTAWERPDEAAFWNAEAR